MNEERPSSERHGERDSQLSAMFDGELSAAECELLARRLARDEALRAQWSRYSLIGAALRAERGVKLHDHVAERVQVALAQEVSYGDSTASDGVGAITSRTPAVAQNVKTQGTHERWLRYARPVLGASVAAGVAAVSILWLQTQGTEPEFVASAPVTESAPVQSIVLEPEVANEPAGIVPSQPEAAALASNGEPNIYSTPAPSSQTNIAPPARFANYVVAHSEYSGPLARRMGLMGILGAEGGADEVETAAAANSTTNSATTNSATANPATANPANSGDR